MFLGIFLCFYINNLPVVLVIVSKIFGGVLATWRQKKEVVIMHFYPVASNNAVLPDSACNSLWCERVLWCTSCSSAERSQPRATKSPLVSWLGDGWVGCLLATRKWTASRLELCLLLCLFVGSDRPGSLLLKRDASRHWCQIIPCPFLWDTSSIENAHNRDMWSYFKLISWLVGKQVLIYTSSCFRAHCHSFTVMVLATCELLKDIYGWLSDKHAFYSPACWCIWKMQKNVHSTETSNI